MLIIKQRAGESIALGEDVHIHVLSVKAGQIRLGIEAPPEVKVTRKGEHGHAAGSQSPVSS